jgi:hypothetical protein
MPVIDINRPDPEGVLERFLVKRNEAKKEIDAKVADINVLRERSVRRIQDERDQLIQAIKAMYRIRQALDDFTDSFRLGF